MLRQIVVRTPRQVAAARSLFGEASKGAVIRPGESETVTVKIEKPIIPIAKIGSQEFLAVPYHDETHYYNINNIVKVVKQKPGIFTNEIKLYVTRVDQGSEIITNDGQQVIKNAIKEGHVV